MSKIITQKICKVDDCEKTGTLHKNGSRYFTKGYCIKHYKHIYRHGKILQNTIYTDRPAIECKDYYKLPLGIEAKDGYAIIDKQHKYLEKHKWWLMSIGYPATSISNHRSNTTPLHRAIMNPPEGMDVDHINHDLLDNRLKNLRICDRSENNANRIIVTNRTGFKGVHKIGNKYTSHIGYKNNNVYLGIYKTPQEAAKEYDNVAIQLFGEFALTNKVIGLI